MKARITLDIKTDDTYGVGDETINGIVRAIYRHADKVVGVKVVSVEPTDEDADTDLTHPSYDVTP